MSVTIASRFCGPPGTGNGGYVCGVVAGHIGGPAEVTLRAPAPLDIALEVSRDGDKVIVKDRDAVIAEARPADPGITAAAPISFADAERAAQLHNPDNQNFFPGCFVCGAGRAPGDGLRIFPGKHNGSDIVAAPWIPTADLANEDGLVAPEFLWAALDCPSYFAQPLAGKKVALLGRFTVAISARPKPGERLAIAAWPMGADGRKHFGGSTIFREDGTPAAVARSVWIELK